MSTTPTPAPGRGAGGTCDLLITGGRVVDPETGLDALAAVAVTGRTITYVGDAAGAPAAPTTLDVAGDVVAPGFVDLHSHAQTVTGLRLQALDGVTTALDLESGALPVAGSCAAAEEQGRPVNVGFSAGWAAARMQVLDGATFRPDARGALPTYDRNQEGRRWRGLATREEVAQISAVLQDALDEGAVGLGMLLGYMPSSGKTEYVALAGLAAANGRPTFTHARYIATEEPDTSLEGALEVIGASAATGAHMHLCHVNSTSVRMIDEVAAAIGTARGQGVRVSTEAYPYGAGATNLGAAFLAPELLHRMGVAPPSLTYVATGERIADAARLAHLRATDPGGAVVLHLLDEDDPRDLAVLERSFLLEDTAVATDAMPLVDPGGAATADAWPPPRSAMTHPRSAGSFGRTLRWLVRESGTLTLVEALRRCSLLPAQILTEAVPAMARKGRVQVGADADLVVFDPATVTDRATYGRLAPTSGFRHVIVGGTPVVRDGEVVTGAMPGRAIRGGDR